MVMKITMTHTRILMATLVIASIGGTFAVVTGFDLTLDTGKNSAPSGALLTGNVKVTHYDGDGQVIGYRQSDNHIVFHGMEIIMGQVFNGMNESYAVPVRPVSHMEIGLAGDPLNWNEALRWNDTDLVDPVIITNPLCVRVAAVTDNVTQGNSHKWSSSCHGTQGFSSTNPCSAQMNVTARATFSGMQCAAVAIDEAGIFNDPVGGLMFARNTFGSVTLNNADSLALDWEFTFTDS